MGLFLDAAMCWKRMLDISYTIIIGHKNEEQTIQLQFHPVDFDHMSGIHYANDVDFHLHRRTFRGDKLIDAVISGKIQESALEKSSHWEQISQRLMDILVLEKLLDDDFQIFRFNRHKLPFYSKIDAYYLLYSEKYQAGIFVFLDHEQNREYCRSIFSKDTCDYTANQTKWTVLQKTKWQHDEKQVLFVRPSYREP